jgi:hypothetical protein
VFVRFLLNNLDDYASLAKKIFRVIYHYIKIAPDPDAVIRFFGKAVDAYDNGLNIHHTKFIGDIIVQVNTVRIKMDIC